MAEHAAVPRPGPLHPRLWDAGALLAGIVAPAVVLAIDPEGVGPGLAPVDAVAIPAGVALILLRHRNPLATLAGGLVTLGAAALLGGGAPLVTAVVVLLFTYSASTGRLAAVAAGLITAATLWATATRLFGADGITDQAFPVLAWCAAAVGFGVASRERRLYVEAVEERARRAEATREEEARRRVAEERLRIARELHDVVAHRMTIVNVQTAVALQALPDRPADAADALRVVGDSARTVLAEMGGMVGVLRSPDGADGPQEPLPTLADLASLVEEFRDSGLEVDWRTRGALGDLPETVQLTAYRVIQEGLTNARRHGGGRADLSVESDAGAIDVRIANGPSAEPRPAGSGLGLTGMRERVAAVGGELTAGPVPGGGFLVSAHIPVPGEAS